MRGSFNCVQCGGLHLKVKFEIEKICIHCGLLNILTPIVCKTCRLWLSEGTKGEYCNYCVSKHKKFTKKCKLCGEEVANIKFRKSLRVKETDSKQRRIILD